MTRPPGDWLLTALGAVVLLALAVLIGAVAYGLSDHETHEQAASVITPAPTIDAVLFNARLRAEDHIRYAGWTPFPSPTPAPTLTGVNCTTDQLSAKQSGENAYTGGTLVFTLNIANSSESACDLPPLESFDALDQNGAAFATKSVSPQAPTCDTDPYLCVERDPVLLQPLQQPVDVRSRSENASAGTAVVGFMYGSRCYPELPSPTPACKEDVLKTVVLHFHALDLPIDPCCVAMVTDGHISVVGAGLVTRKSP